MPAIASVANAKPSIALTLSACRIANILTSAGEYPAIVAVVSFDEMNVCVDNRTLRGWLEIGLGEVL